MFSTSLNREKRARYMYQPISKSEDDIDLAMLSPRSSTESAESTFSCYHCSMKRNSLLKTTSRLILVLNIGLTFILLGLIATGLGSHVLPWKPLNYHLKHTNMPSPLLDKLDIKLTEQKFNGFLFNRGDSIFRQPPSPEVDKAWNDISRLRNFAVDRADIVKAGKDPEISVRFPESWGMGEKYLAQLDAPHQLHCLNELRKQAYADYYYGPGGSTNPLQLVHITHCLDVIRQNLMCSASTEIITFTWTETQDQPWYDFNTNHMCRDYDAVHQWMYDQFESLDWDNKPNFTKPEGIKLQPMEADYYRIAPALAAWQAVHGKGDHAHNHS